jgi:RNA polymerase sigma factor (sigma-70 family)
MQAAEGPKRSTEEPVCAECGHALSDHASGPCAVRTGSIPWPDERLVRECLKGSEEAWSSLIDKYKRLIFSIPIKYGLPPVAAADIFQEVCLSLLAELPKLREPRALAAWLIQTTSHRCAHWKREEQRHAPVETEEQAALPRDPSKMPEEILLAVQQEQIVREALAELPARCQQLIHMLFFQDPALPYQEVARSLQIATGSVGFIRMRCLGRLRRTLEKRGFR